MSLPMGGFNAVGDVVTKTADGRDLNYLWAEYQQVLAEYNAQEKGMIDFLISPTEQIIDYRAIPSAGATNGFERMSQFGVPRAPRAAVQEIAMGYPFDWFDRAVRFTWQFLAEATQGQVDAEHSTVIREDSELMFNSVMNRFFSNVNNQAAINKQPFTSYAFWNADGSMAPPRYRANVFQSSHQHYMTTDGALTAEDLDLLIDNVEHHGYSKENGYQILVMINAQEAPTIRTFRAAATREGVDAGVVEGRWGAWDFIPAQGTNAQLLPSNVVLLGTQPGSSYRGMTVIGSYGPALIVQNEFVSPGYIPCLATGGPKGLSNPLAMRQHQNQDLRGLRLVKGANPDYPLIDAYYVRGFGVGIRDRSQGAILQVTADGVTTYTPPVQYTSAVV